MDYQHIRTGKQISSMEYNRLSWADQRDYTRISSSYTSSSSSSDDTPSYPATSPWWEDNTNSNSTVTVDSTSTPEPTVDFGGSDFGGGAGAGGDY